MITDQLVYTLGEVAGLLVYTPYVVTDQLVYTLCGHWSVILYTLGYMVTDQCLTRKFNGYRCLFLLTCLKLSICKDSGFENHLYKVINRL